MDSDEKIHLCNLYSLKSDRQTEEVSPSISETKRIKRGRRIWTKKEGTLEGKKEWRKSL
jgi:hypothetical protein